MSKKKRGQTWSVDLVIGVVIFLLLVVVFYSLFAVDRGEYTVLREEADYALGALSQGSSTVTGVPKIIQGQRLNQTELQALYATDYATLKAQLGITSDFCIVVVDDTGGLVQVGGKYSQGTGSDLELAEGIFCGN